MIPDQAEGKSSIREFLSNLPHYLIYLGAGLLVLDEFLKLMFDKSILVSDHLRIAVMVSSVLLFATATNTKLDALVGTIKKIKITTDKNIDLISDGDRPRFSELIQNSKELRILSLSGTKTIPLGDDRVVDAILDRKRTARLTILLADPDSQLIKCRYQFDEPASYETGLEGIERRLFQLHSILGRADSALQRRTEIRVFACYPTIAMVWADDEVYSISYGFRLRGSDCPQVHSRASGEHGEFLIKHFNKVYESAMPLSDWIAKHAQSQKA